MSSDHYVVVSQTDDTAPLGKSSLSTHWAAPVGFQTAEDMFQDYSPLYCPFEVVVKVETSTITSTPDYGELRQQVKEHALRLMLLMLHFDIVERDMGGCKSYQHLFSALMLMA